MCFCFNLGNIGIVKDATQTTARIELHTSCQTISVDRTHIKDVGTPAKVFEYMWFPAQITNMGGFFFVTGWKYFQLLQDATTRW